MTILSILNVLPNEVLMIGDNVETDIIAAQQAGIDACFLNRKNNMNNDSDYFKIHNLSELQIQLSVKLSSENVPGEDFYDVKTGLIA